MRTSAPRRLISWVIAHSGADGGVSTVMLAIMLPVLLGMQALVIDGTRLFVERGELQNAVDAAALAAARYLPSTEPEVLALAVDAAVDFAARNGVEIDPADVTFSADQTPFDRVTVRASNEVWFAFAPSLGFSFGSVASHGTAQLGTLGGMFGVAPWGIEDTPGGFVFGEEYCLKLGSASGGCSGANQGNFHALDIDDTGNASADTYRDRIKYGSLTVVRVGQVKDVVPGNMQGPTQQGTGCSGNNGLISGNASVFEDVVVETEDGYLVLDWANSRLVVIPTVIFIAAHQAEVTGFGLFFIEECGGNGSVTGRFVDTVIPGGEWAPWANGHGTKAVRLVE